MTRPRSYQLNDPNERFTRIPLPVTPQPGSSDITFTLSDYAGIINASSTSSVGGSTFDLPAVITGIGCESPSGITLVAGNQFTVTVNAISYLITLQAGDFDGLGKTSVSRLVNRINTTVGSSVASRVEIGSNAALRLTSSTTGVSSAITIAPTGASGETILLNIGYGPGVSRSATGINATRGIVTKSADGLGGVLYFSKADGYDLEANSSTYYRLPKATADRTGIQYVQDVVPGSRVYARLTQDPTVPSFTCAFKSKALRYVKAVSKQSNFNAFVGTESITVVVTDQISNTALSFSATMPSAPTNVSSVVSAFNAAFSTLTGNSTGRVIARNVGPFYPSVGTVRTLELKVDGVTKPLITFASTDITAAQISAVINSTVSMSIASDVSGRLVISSPTTGSSSSIEIVSITDELAKQLGVVKGLYKGYEICRQNGYEIEFVVPWPSARISIAGTTGDLGNLGFSVANFPRSAGDYLADEIRELDAPFPSMYENSSLNQPNYILGMWPEYEELGDVPNDQFAKERSVDDVGDFKHLSPNTDAIASKAGSAVVTNDLGSIDPSSAPYSVPYGQVGGLTLPPLRGVADWPSNPVASIDQQGLYTNVLDVRKPADASARFAVEAGPSGPELLISSNVSVPTGLSYSGQIAGLQNPALSASLMSVGATGVSIKLKPSAASDWSFNSWVPAFSVYGLTGITGINWSANVSNDTLVYGQGGPLKLSDENLGTAPSTRNFLPLSGSTASNGDAALRLGDAKVQDTSSLSLLRALNSSIEIVCGDGIDTFGHFNGTDAIDQAAAWINSQNVASATIIIKRGSYTPSSTISFSEKNISIIGQEFGFDSSGGVYVNKPSTSNQHTFSFTGTDKIISFKNIKFAPSDTNYSSITGYSTVHVFENCEVFGFKLSCGQVGGFPNTLLADNTTFRAGGPNNAILDITYLGNSSDGFNQYEKPFIFNGCLFQAHGIQNAKCLYLTIGPGSVALNGNFYFSAFDFNDCEFRLGYYSATSGPIMVSNTGLIELNPGNDGRLVDGLLVKRVRYNDCSIKALNSEGYNCILSLSSSRTNTSTVSTTLWGRIKTLIFENCEFSVLLPQQSATNAIVPFMVGDGTRDLTIKDCSYEYKYGANPTYGSAPSWWNGANGPMSNNTSGGICIACTNVEVESFTIDNAFCNTSLGTTLDGRDLVIGVGKSVAVDELIINYVYAGYATGGIPKYRVQIEKSTRSSIASSAASASIRRLLLNGNGEAFSKWAADGYMKSMCPGVVYEQCKIGPGFAYQDQEALIGLHLTSYTSNEFLNGVSVIDSSFFGSTGIYVDAYKNGVGGYNYNVDNINIDSNIVTALGTTQDGPIARGIRFYSLNCPQKINISNNKVFVSAFDLSSGPEASGGIVISSKIDVPVTRILVRNNTVQTETTSQDPGALNTDVPGILLIPNNWGTTLGSQPAIVKDNVVTAWDGSSLIFGKISILQLDIGGAPVSVVSPTTYIAVASPVLVNSAFMSGLETSYGGGGAASINSYNYANSGKMVHNAAFLRNTGTV